MNTRQNERSAHCIESNINSKIFRHTFPSPARLVERRGGRSRGRELLYIMLPHAKPSRVQGRVRAKRTAERSRPCQNGGNIRKCRPDYRTTDISRPEQYITLFSLAIGMTRWLPKEAGEEICGWQRSGRRKRSSVLLFLRRF